VLVPSRRLDAHDEPQSRQHVGVMHMARPARLLRIVADDRTLLMAVERLHRRVDVENVFLRQQWMRAQIDVPLQPLQARSLVDRLQRAAHRILADDLGHPE
jgi:hypothetical protein